MLHLMQFILANIFLFHSLTLCSLLSLIQLSCLYISLCVYVCEFAFWSLSFSRYFHVICFPFVYTRWILAYWENVDKNMKMDFGFVFFYRTCSSRNFLPSFLPDSLSLSLSLISYIKCSFAWNISFLFVVIVDEKNGDGTTEKQKKKTTDKRVSCKKK